MEFKVGDRVRMKNKGYSCCVKNIECSYNKNSDLCPMTLRKFYKVISLYDKTLILFGPSVGCGELSDINWDAEAFEAIENWILVKRK